MMDPYLSSADPTQEACARSFRSYGSHRVTWATPYRPSPKYLDHQVGIGDLSDVGTYIVHERS